MNIYVASSWRNAKQPAVVAALRQAGHTVYDFKNPEPGNSGFSWAEIDPNWQQWTPREFQQQLLVQPLAQRGFALDARALDDCDACVLVLPCGRSAHLELGWVAGKGKKTLVILDEPLSEPELMYLLCDNVCITVLEALDLLSMWQRQSFPECPLGVVGA